MSVTKMKLLAVGVLGILLLAGCSKAKTPSGSSGGTSGPKTVAIKMLDSLRFEPASVTVKAGDTVRFVITNAGKTTHEFILGDQSVQDAEEQQMKQNMNMSSQSPMGAMAALVLAPGETKDATVTFDKSGTMQYGCHEPGHYAAGMVGTVSVT